MKRRTVNRPYNKVVISTVNAATFFDRCSYCIHDNYLKMIPAFGSDVVRTNEYYQGNMSKFQNEFLTLLLSLINATGGEIDERPWLVHLNLQKEGDTSMFGVCVKFNKVYNDGQYTQELNFDLVLKSDEDREMEINIGTFDLKEISNTNVSDIIIGDFSLKNPNMLRPWLVFDFKRPNKIIFNCMPVNIRQFFSPSTNEFKIIDYSIKKEE